MIDFRPFSLDMKQHYDTVRRSAGERGCEYGFVNLFLWGRQNQAFVNGHYVYFSQFHRRSVYLFPMGEGDIKPALDAAIHDAHTRGIPCRFTGMLEAECDLLNRLYPGKFHYHHDRDSFDYVYDIHDLAELKGKKFQKKRNHLNRFWAANPDAVLSPITEENLDRCKALVEKWYRLRLENDPHADFQMEQVAIRRALEHWAELNLEGLILTANGEDVAMTVGSTFGGDTFDIHFEKALDIADGAYAAINNGFAKYLREKYPSVLYLNREDDMGLEGLRKAKLSYNPHHLVEKYWACYLEDGCDY